ncbi:MAG: hypothetical protein HUJ31_06680, partial [Pseudomonadales bacterium]|nr:hypothetical protein [Pseudomonadales bacterium]
MFDATSGRRLDPLGRDDAIRVASTRTDIEPVDAMLVTEVPPGHEYRGGPLPAWQVRLAN